MKVIARFALLAVALLLALLVGEYALYYRPTESSILLGITAAIVLAAGFWLGTTYFNRRRQPETLDPEYRARRVQDRGITARELEVLELVAEGLSNQEIADRLYIAETTVKSHVSSLLDKLNARRRTEAVNIAHEEGLLR